MYSIHSFSLRNSPRPVLQQPPAFFPTRNGIPRCFLFRGMVGNRIPRVCFYFCSTERNSELFCLPRKGSERNSESLLLFLFHGKESRVVFSSAEGFGMEFRRFLFRGTAGIPSEKAFVLSIPSSAELFFCRKFPTLPKSEAFMQLDYTVSLSLVN